ncbi:MurR/RpiR family transcriptional regulator [Bifidobacterium tibiigranuli]|uniref:MurR/RpiR family transcriptional regulator n=1 Tax=Bifidobacterium tibiigranuli TaxID=2172043 RepID=UPI0034C67E7D
MQSSAGILDRLESVFPSLRPAERTAATYLRDHIDQAGAMSVRELAEAAGVSQPTVIRLARRLGFEGYRAMRFTLRHPQAASVPSFEPLEGFELNPWDTLEDVPARTVNSAKTLLNDLAHAVDQDSLRKAVSLLANSSFIDIYGVENSVTPATDLCTKLSYLGLTCRFNSDAYLQQVGAGNLHRGDLAVAFSYSGRSTDTIKALRLAKSQGARTVSITNSANAPLSQYADVRMFTGRGERQIYGSAIFSRVAYTTVVDMLYIGVIASDYQRFSAELDRSARLIADRGRHV